jgi:hypothetical protein
LPAGERRAAVMIASGQGYRQPPGCDRRPGVAARPPKTHIMAVKLFWFGLLSLL